MSQLIVRRPSPRLADGELTHLDRVPVDPELALQQWQGYVDVWAERGWQVHELDPSDDHPDGVFVEDTVVVFDDLAVLTHPGAESRRGEVSSTSAGLDVLRRGGLEVEVSMIESPGHLDGGDVLKVDRTAYVGLGSRTDEAGIDQLRALIEPRGWRVVTVPISRVLHLKSGVTALPDGTVIGYPPLVDAPESYPVFLPVPEVHGTAVVDLGDGHLIMSSDAPQTAELFTGRGWHVHPVPITEFEKLEGCVTCLSVRIR